LAVSVRSTKPSDTAYTKLVVSRVAAAVLGGYAVTYWAGAAVAKLAIEWQIFNRVDAGMFSGLVQLVVYVTAIIWVCAAASMKKAWWALAVVTALLIGIVVLTPGPPPTS
jgi:hypothetical protein